MRKSAVRAIAACLAVAFVPVFASRVSAHPDPEGSYAPTGITNLVADVVSGQPRRITISFNAPDNAETSTLSGYFVQYRCLSKTSQSAPCTGKWRSVTFEELPDDSTLNGQLMTYQYTLPAGIAGTSGRPVSLRIIPASDDDNMTLGPTSAAAVINIRDTPVLVGTPISTGSRSKQRITVTLPGTVVDQTRGSGSWVYTVEYSRNNKSWTSLTGANAPSGGWAPGKSKIVSVPASGVRYYFRVKIASNAGTTTQNPPKSQVAR